MTRNERYWTERANRRMDNYTISAMEQAKIIQRSYNQTYNYVQSEISKILRHIGDEGTLAYEYRMKRLNTLLIKMDRKMRQLYNINIKDTTSFLKRIIPEAYYHTIFDISQGLGYLPQFSAVNTRLINQIITDQWSGKNYSERIWWNVDKLAIDTRQILTTAAMTGESIYKTSRRLSQRFGQSAYCSQRLIRTETTYSCNQAELTAYKELDIEKYKFVATLDTRTSPACQDLDGKVFAVKDAKAGINLPAMHPNCRSTTISFFGGYEPSIRFARDKDGNRIKVPANMTYKDWYKKYIDTQDTSSPPKGNNTPKPTEAPQKPSVKPTEGNAVDVPVSEPVNSSEAYTDTPIPPKINNQSIDNSVQNDIIELKDRNDSLFPDIADKAPKLSYFDDEALNNQIQSAADSILDMAKNHVRGTEFAYIISTDSPYALSEPIIGGEGMMAVKIPRCDYSAITLHNHPSGGTFSARDIDRFVVDENAKAMCLIGNSGNWYILEKTDSFNWFKFQMDVFDFAYSDDFADIILKGADKYGFKYYEKIYR